ncbi:MAG TPA: trypsin-like peptidase domain-containing protein [Chthonomonadales bacterium]|nr:trypsin-like peptidase domain-containing protein [Chthonomonadales bacterium]
MQTSRVRTLLLVITAFILGGLVLPNIRISWREPSARANLPWSKLSANLPPEEIYARAAAIAGPSVVNIDTEKRVRVRRFFFEEEFFGPRFQRITGSGSGVIIGKNGEIVTNSHVVEGADSIAVTLSDGRTFRGRVIGSDYITDVALVKIDANNLPVARLGTSRDLVPGQLAIAIGNPLGLRFTVTHGIVSQLGRPRTLDGRVYENLIQTDTAINPGNSGGALVDREGKVIGINTLVAEGAQGVGFAIPIDTVMRIAGELRKYGKVKRPWTGMLVTAITEDIQAYFGLPSREGVIVTRVVRGGPADQAGIQPGDILLELAGQRIRNEEDYRRIAGGLRIGQRAGVLILREEGRFRGEIVIQESP